MDEINSVQDAQVVQSIVARGIRVIAGASSCTSLASLLTNPDLTSLVRCATAVGSSLGPTHWPPRCYMRHMGAASMSLLQDLFLLCTECECNIGVVDNRALWHTRSIYTLMLMHGNLYSFCCTDTNRVILQGWYKYSITSREGGSSCLR